MFVAQGERGLHLDKIIESFIAKDFKDFQVLETVENVILFTRNMLNADNVIIWFEHEDKDTFWSYMERAQIFLEKDRIEPILQNRINTFINRETHLGFIKELEKLPHHSKDVIENVMFHKVFCENYKSTILIEVVNLSKQPFQFTNNTADLLQILSLFIAQTIKMQDITELAKYYFDEQEKAYLKQKTVIQNDLENSNILDVNVFYEPSDILNGDSYSIYHTPTGDTLVYIIDAMGHGIGPSLTAYSISAIIQNRIKSSDSFHDLMENLLDNVQYILTDEEQLTCGFFWFAEDLSKVEYVVAGMYAPMILDGDKVISAKANNIPFMNFAFDFSITTIDLTDFKKFLIFTDGLVEDTQELNVDLEKMLRDDSYTENIFDKLSFMNLEDDTTIIKLSKRE